MFIYQRNKQTPVPYIKKKGSTLFIAVASDVNNGNHLTLGSEVMPVWFYRNYAGSEAMPQP